MNRVLYTVFDGVCVCAKHLSSVDFLWEGEGRGWDLCTCTVTP